MSSIYIDKVKGKINFSFFNKVPLILQTETSECGLASLAMICHYYGLEVDLYTLRSSYGISSRGATLSTLIDVAKSLKLQSRALTLSLEEIKSLRLPCILHWDMRHFVVLVNVKHGKAEIHDPAFGRKVISLHDLSQYFTGVALELWPCIDFKPLKKEKKLHLGEFFTNVKKIITTGLLKIFFLSIIIEAINLSLPIGTQLVMDHVIVAGDHDLLNVICIGLLVFILFRIGLSILRSWVSIVMMTFIDIQWKANLFDHLMRLPLSFFEKRNLGDIHSRFSSLDTIRTTFSTSIVSSIIDSVISIGLLLMMFFYGSWLVWVVIGFTSLYLILRIFSYRHHRQVSEEQIVKGSRANSYFMESLYSIATLKSLGIYNIRSQNWLNLNVDAINSGIKLTRLNLFFGGTSTLIAVFDQIAILWLGAGLVINNEMTIGMFVAFNAYRGQFSERVSNLIGVILQFRMLSLHSERVADIALSLPEQHMPVRNLFPKGKAISLQTHNVYYQHDRFAEPIINNLNISIMAGECVAIIGPSGVGKTTLMKILAGLLIPGQGKILIDGLEIKQLGINNYRQSIACILQDDKLLAGSIADNIAGFDADIELERVEACARRCNIHDDIIRMQMGYDTLLGELGCGLSGGQVQRLLIARALYRKPSILFMDEATSSLDLENEAFINSAISKLNITRIIVSHRQSTISHAHRVIDLGASTIAMKNSITSMQTGETV